MVFKSLFNWSSQGQVDTISSNDEHKFGTFFGVFVPNITMMFGVIIFMRLCIAVGYIPLWQYLSIVLTGFAVMSITSLSIAMITTNMKIGTGGAYYLISRSLGIEFGGAIGICLVLSQIISLAVCTTGFAYTISFVYPDISPFVVEFVTLLALTLISFVSANLALKTQFFIFCLLLASVGSVFFSDTSIYENSTSMDPYFPEGLSYWTAFGLVYPAMTGIEAGMALSGNLKNPSRSLWVGCLLSLILVAATYIALGSYFSILVPTNVLQANPFIVIEMSRVKPLIYLGIWGATLSSALGNLLGGPRMLQSMSEDGIAPKIFKKVYGTHKEPRYALGLVFLIALAMMFLTTIDQILPVSAMVCLMTYGFLNLAAGVADWIHNPTWRPLVRIPWFVSMFGAFLCFSLMFMINAPWALVTVLLVVGFYILMRTVSVDVPFQDIRENIIFFFSRFAVYYLSKAESHAHHWHPQLLVFSKVPTADLNIMNLSSSIASRSGLLSLALIIPDNWEDEYQIATKKQMFEDYLEKNKINGLVDVQAYSQFAEGVQNMIKSYGLGELQPNTLVLKLAKEDTADYVSFIETAKIYQKNVMLVWDESEGDLDQFSTASRGKEIAIWWSPEETSSFELILSYIHSLTSGANWMGSQITLHAVVFDDNQREHVANNMEDFISRSRIKINYEIHVEEEEIKHLGRYIEASSGADLVFSSLRPFEEAPEIYYTYLESLVESLPANQQIVFVTSYDAINHREIYS